MPRRFVLFFLRDHRLLARYIGVGLASAAIEFGLFSLLYLRLEWALLLANCTAVAIAMMFNFSAHRYFTFGVVDDTRRRLWRYLGMQSVALVMNNALVWLFIKEWAMWAPLAKGLQIGIVFLWTFSVSRLVVFKEGEGA